jgi:hypothetical protein
MTGFMMKMKFKNKGLILLFVLTYGASAIAQDLVPRASARVPIN